jgi:hypothetical protein
MGTARRADTVESYQQFLTSFPDGEFAAQAQARVRELEEESDWQNTTRADTAEAYQDFLNRWPQGRMADEARIRIGNFALAQTPSSSPLETPPAAVPPPGAAAVSAPALQFRAVSDPAQGVQRRRQAGDRWWRRCRLYPALLGG